MGAAWGITAVRVATAVILIHAGWLKFFTYGVTTGVAANMEKYGFPMPTAFAIAAATLELFGGILLLIGLFTRWLGVLFAIQFAIALFYVKLRLATFAEGRLDIMILAAVILLMLAGPGRLAVDGRKS